MHTIYKRNPNFVLGFHGCDESIGEAVLSGDTTLTASDNIYDWLGKGIYFWEGNPTRAHQFATDAITRKMTTKGKVQKPFVVGAIIDLGLCCNLHDQSSLEELKVAYQELALAAKSTNMPKNRGGPDALMRELDCAVINFLHVMREDTKAPPYDTVRAAFHEGGELYSGSGFTEKSHIQIAVRHERQILGYFRPR